MQNMKPVDRMGLSLLPFTLAVASHTRWGIKSWSEFEARNVLTPFDSTRWDAGAFAPVSLVIGWDTPQHCIGGLWLSPDTAIQTGLVEVDVEVNGKLLCTHQAQWTHGEVFSLFFPRLVHTATVTLTFTKTPSWVALLWIQAWQYRGEPAVLKSPIALQPSDATALRRRAVTPASYPPESARPPSARARGPSFEAAPPLAQK